MRIKRNGYNRNVLDQQKRLHAPDKNLLEPRPSIVMMGGEEVCRAGEELQPTASCCIVKAECALKRENLELVGTEWYQSGCRIVWW